VGGATALASTGEDDEVPVDIFAEPGTEPMPDIVRTSQGPRSVQELIEFWESKATATPTAATPAAAAAGPAAAFTAVFDAESSSEAGPDAESALTESETAGGSESLTAVDAAALLASLPRAMTVAPPRISVSPERTGDVIDGDGPPIPASAYPALQPGRLGAMSAGSAAEGQTGSNDDAFAALAHSVLGPQTPRTGAPPPLPVPPGGPFTMPDSSMSTASRNGGGVTQQQQQPQPFAEFAEGTQAERMDALVDRVIERIEERVVDELERRGRRHSRGVF
jgi:hypothetical protein